MQRQPREPFRAASPWLQFFAALPLSGAAPFDRPLTARQLILVDQGFGSLSDALPEEVMDDGLSSSLYYIL